MYKLFGLASPPLALPDFLLHAIARNLGTALIGVRVCVARACLCQEKRNQCLPAQIVCAQASCVYACEVMHMQMQSDTCG